MRVIKIGRCIYCKTTTPPLRREHMIAAGLNGPWVLHEASCKKHADVTSAFEGQVLGSILRPARAGLKMRMTQRPTTLPLLIDRGDGEFTSIDVPVEDYPAAVIFLEYPPPAYLDGRPYVSGVSVCGQRTVQVAGPPPDEIGRRLGAKKLQLKATFVGNTFERLIAKIAYTFVVADVGLDGIESAYVLPAILGEADDMGRWFGCDAMAYITDPRYLHGVAMQVIGREAIVRVRLFVNAPTPEYIVVVGKLAPGAATCKFQATDSQGTTRTRSLDDVLANAQHAPPAFLPSNQSISVQVVPGLAAKKKP
jgi:hypothetical protein